jgi:CheY-like chemotaxis protein
MVLDSTDNAFAPARRTRKVLVVDDNVDAADSLSMMLELSGHEVCTVYDGPAALAALPAFGPQVVLLDIGLPRMDGYEVARRIRSTLPAGRDMLLVALTGWGQAEDKRRAREAGFDQHFTKPVDPLDIARYVEAGGASEAA